MDRAEKIKKLIAALKLGHELKREDAVILKPVTMEMILGYDEVARQKRKRIQTFDTFRHLRGYCDVRSAA